MAGLEHMPRCDDWNHRDTEIPDENWNVWNHECSFADPVTSVDSVSLWFHSSWLRRQAVHLPPRRRDCHDRSAKSTSARGALYAAKGVLGQLDRWRDPDCAEPARNHRAGSRLDGFLPGL